MADYRPLRFVLLTAALALFGFVLPACGGDPDSTSCTDTIGVCSSGGRCAVAGTGEAQRYPDPRYTCPGGGSTGGVCCVACQVAADSPAMCCTATATFNPVCISGKVGCPSGMTGKPAGSSCN